MPEEHKHQPNEKHHSHEKNEGYNFQISKVRLWQITSVVLFIVVLFLWFAQGSGTGSIPVQQPTGAVPSAQPGQLPQLPSKQQIDLDDDPVLGDENAPVTIVSFEDYQCPFCGRAFQQTFPQLKKDYIDSGKVKYVYRDFPLSFHPEAQPAAEASECADEQGKFWEYHDALYENQQSLGTTLYTKLAGDFGLDVSKFSSCLESGKYRQEVQNDFAYGSQVGVSGTPTFFINGIKLVGAQPYQAFKQVIDAELANQ